MKAIWNGAVIAESSSTEVVEGNQYFPPDSIKREYFKDSATSSVCPWKGTASYYTVDVDGKQNKDAAWYYPTPKGRGEKTSRTTSRSGRASRSRRRSSRRHLSRARR